mgnify:CR=1 FL=1
MTVFEMVARITVVALIAGVAREHLSRSKIPEVDLSGIENRLDKLEKLQKRIETLEAIVTDKGYDLTQEINNLK